MVNISREIGGERFDDLQESEILEIVALGKDPLTAADVEDIVESANEKLEKTILPEDENDELDKKNFMLYLKAGSLYYIKLF